MVLPNKDILFRWSTWKSLYNNTKVLNRDTGFKYNYNNDPYPGYSHEERYITKFSKQPRDDDFDIFDT